MAISPVSATLLSRMLMITAFVNVSTGLEAVFLPNLFTGLLYTRPLGADPFLWRYHITFWSFVLVMGLAYGLAARHPREKAILLAGGLGKLLAAGIFAEMILSGLATWLMAGAVLFDGSFGLFFLLALKGVKD